MRLAHLMGLRNIAPDKVVRLGEVRLGFAIQRLVQIRTHLVRTNMPLPLLPLISLPSPNVSRVKFGSCFAAAAADIKRDKLLISFLCLFKNEFIAQGLEEIRARASLAFKSLDFLAWHI